MIMCTRCGTENDDAAISCRRCGRKLQSLRRRSTADRPVAEPLQPLNKTSGGQKYHALLRRCLEVWTVAALVVGVAFWGLPAGVGKPAWWAAVAALVLGGLWALLRR